MPSRLRVLRVMLASAVVLVVWTSWRSIMFAPASEGGLAGSLAASSWTTKSGDKSDLPDLDGGAAEQAKGSGSSSLPKGLEESKPRADCDREIPIYDAAKWISEHGPDVLPDHPAIFRDSDHIEIINKARSKLGDLKAFVEAYGDEQLWWAPVYGCDGGIGSRYFNHDTEGKTVKQMAKLWEDADDHSIPHYFHDFFCATHFCKTLIPDMVPPKVVKSKEFFNAGINLLMGGPRSGLVFHIHEVTWQALWSGRKQWYVIPPTSISEEIYDMVGPMMFPASGWGKLTEGLPVGKRPLKCIQHPGDIFYVPDQWWHATENLDQFQLAYGAKPKGMKFQQGSPALAAIYEKLPRHPKFSAIGQWDLIDSKFMMQHQIDAYIEKCNVRGNSSPKEHWQWLEEMGHALTTINEIAVKHSKLAGNTVTADLSAFAYCFSADQIITRVTADHEYCHLDVRQKFSEKWKVAAEHISHGIAMKECKTGNTFSVLDIESNRKYVPELPKEL